MWRSLNHDHVLPFLGIYEDDSASYLVSPYMKNGTLTQWRKKENPSITEIGDRVWLLFSAGRNVDSLEDVGSRSRHGIHTFRRGSSR